jgi:aspartate racemase
LKALSQREGLTLFMTLLAAFKALLHRYTGQDDVLVGSPIANRNRREVEGLIGFFVNTLVLRTDLAGNPSFRELLAQVCEVTLGAYAHQDLPFEMLVEELQPERDLSRSPLFQVMFTLQNAPQEPLALPGLALSPLEVENKVAKFDLTLSMAVTAAGLSGTLEYNTDLFDAATMARLADHWQTLLAGVVSDPGQRLSDLPLLTPAQRRQLLVEWNDTQRATSPAFCLHHLFEAQAARSPDVVALVFPSTSFAPASRTEWPSAESASAAERTRYREDQHLSYGELNRRANQLARHLQGMGVGPEVLVGVCLERSAEAIVGLLGVLKAGGAYVPLDATDPPERLAYILQDARTHILLTRQHFLERLSPPLLHTPYSLLLLDADWPIVAQESCANPTGRVTPHNLAYVIYTSGSTGAPKGVLVSHEAIARHCADVRRYYRLAADDRVLQFTALNFDASLEQIFPTLSAGASLVLRDGQMWSPGEFFRKALRYGLTVVDLPPAYWHCLVGEWANASEGGLEEQLRLVIVGGDVMQPSSLYHWQQLPVRRVRLLNAYGPTEATITATAYEAAACADAEKPLARVPVGRPLAGRRVYVVDRYGDLVPVGVPGELCVGGAGLARGYLNQPVLTAQRFVPNPFISYAGGARLYRTGDLARYRPDGNIELLGRIDHQVKIRGFRIELGEIETLLRDHPGVREAVALARKETPGDECLMAYVVPVADRQAPNAETSDSPASAALIAELRIYLQLRLPVYMVPSAFVTLDALPLTSRGKLDRRALPPPEETGFDLAHATVAPRDALELQLVQIWEELLGVQPIGVRHNFFELGGHSLLAVRLLARIRRDVGPELSLATLFQNPTIEHLAILLRQDKMAVAPFSALVPMQAGHPDKRPLFLVHPAGGNVLCYVDLVRHLGHEQPCYGLQARGLDGERAPHTQVKAMAGYYVTLLRTVQPDGPYLLGGWSIGGVIAFEMAQQFLALGQEVNLLALIDSHVPQDYQETESDDLTLLANFALDLGLPLERMQFDTQHLRQLDADARLALVLEEAKRVHVLPGDLELAQVCRLFQVFKNNVQAVARYEPRVYAGTITLFKAQERAAKFDAYLGWGAVAAGGLTTRTIPGNHYTLVREPHVKVLADQFKHHLHILEGAKRIK